MRSPSSTQPDSATAPLRVGRGTDQAPVSAAEPSYVGDAVARARRGERQALAELYCSFADPVYGCVYRILQDTHEAEDVTQQVFLKLMSILPRYERREVPFSAWLMRVARNMALDALRKRRPVQGEEYLPCGAPSEDPGQRLSSSLLDALEALPLVQRRVVVMRHVVGLSAAEVAERLEKTTGSIHALDQRARRTLKTDLTKYGSAPATRGQRPSLPSAA